MKKALFIFLLLFPVSVFAAPQDVRITEIMYDAPDGDAGHEWVELWNGGSEPVTIVGGSGVGSWRFNDGENHIFPTTPIIGSLTLAPGDFLIIIPSNPGTFDHPNFSGNLVKVTFKNNALNNTGGTLSLKIGTAGTPWSEVPYSKNQGANGNGKTLEWNRDTNAWSESADVGGTPGGFGTSGSTPPPPPPPSETPASEPEPAPAPEQTAEEIPPPPATTPAAEPPPPESVPETAINNEAEPEKLEILVDFPSADAASEPTVSSNENTAQPASSFVSLASIREVKLESRVRVRGTVIATPAISTGQIFYIADEQAGVQIYSSKKDFPALSLGDMIEVTGTVGEANKERRVRISASDAIKVVGSGPIPPAVEVTIANLTDELVGRLVRLSGVAVARTSSGFTIEDESGELAIYLGEASGIAAPAEGEEMIIVGVLGRGRQSYRLLPRSPEDITVTAVAPAAVATPPVRSASPLAAPVMVGVAAMALGLWGRKDMAIRALGVMRVFFKKK